VATRGEIRETWRNPALKADAAQAYLRYSKTCLWCIFERSDFRLTVWHKDFRASDANFERIEIEKVLSSNSFAAVPGYRPDQEVVLRGAFIEWLHDPADGVLSN
jgi:hypothetical protein